jgi:NADH:ubiquinone oxidoreductase subunit H
VDVTRGLLFTLLVAAALLIAFAFAAADPARARWSLRGALAAAFQQWSCALPAGLAMLATCFASGIDLDDVVHAQGPWPWQWNAFQSPGLFVAAVLLLLGAVARPGRSMWRLEQARPPRLGWRGDGDGWFDRLYLCSICALAAAVFLGGDSLPAGLDGGGWLSGLWRAVVLSSKYTLLVLGVAFLRGLCLGINARQWSPFALRWCVPSALGAVAVSELWRRLAGVSPFWGWLERGFGPACLVASVLGVGLVALRIHAASREPGPPSLSPWL